MNVIDVYAILMAAFWSGLAIFLIANRSKVHYLREIEAIESFAFPAMTIVIPVRNEAQHVETALQSVIKLSYPQFTILVINDRSTDGTGKILERLAENSNVIKLLNIDRLPEGWLGKNHAMFRGYQQSETEWILFTDADVNFKNDTLRKAMQFAVQNQLDHLTILPEVTSRSAMLNAALGMFSILLELKHQPWNVRNPASKASLGVGAFNLVRRSVYQRAGTHEALALRPDDDLKLGERMKLAGGKSDVLYGDEQIWLEWYASLREFVSGLMKNTFSIFNYRLFDLVITGVLPLQIFFLLPVPVLLISAQTLPYAMLAFVMGAQALIFHHNRGVHARWWHFMTIPFSSAVMTFILLRSAFLTIRQKGIYWRDTFYALNDLKRSR